MKMENAFCHARESRVKEIKNNVIIFICTRTLIFYKTGKCFLIASICNSYNQQLYLLSSFILSCYVAMMLR